MLMYFHHMQDEAVARVQKQCLLEISCDGYLNACARHSISEMCTERRDFNDASRHCPSCRFIPDENTKLTMGSAYLKNELLNASYR